MSEPLGNGRMGRSRFRQRRASLFLEPWASGSARSSARPLRCARSRKVKILTALARDAVHARGCQWRARARRQPGGADDCPARGHLPRPAHQRHLQAPVPLVTTIGLVAKARGVLPIELPFICLFHSADWKRACATRTAPEAYTEACASERVDPERDAGRAIPSGGTLFLIAW
jgi:hypothetical protein